jgi:hypothetical protein
MKHYWHEAAYIPDAADPGAAWKIAARFSELRDDELTGGFVLRRFERLTSAEARTWWVNGTCRLANPPGHARRRAAGGPRPVAFSAADQLALPAVRHRRPSPPRGPDMAAHRARRRAGQRSLGDYRRRRVPARHPHRLRPGPGSAQVERAPDRGRGSFARCDTGDCQHRLAEGRLTTQRQAYIIAIQALQWGPARQRFAQRRIGVRRLII